MSKTISTDQLNTLLVLKSADANFHTEAAQIAKIIFISIQKAGYLGNESFQIPHCFGCLKRFRMGTFEDMTETWINYHFGNKFVLPRDFMDVEHPVLLEIKIWRPFRDHSKFSDLK